MTFKAIKEKVKFGSQTATFLPNSLFSSILFRHVRVYTLTHENIVFPKWHYIKGKGKGRAWKQSFAKSK